MKYESPTGAGLSSPAWSAPQRYRFGSRISRI